jgi:hypothetical protein
MFANVAYALTFTITITDAQCNVYGINGQVEAFWAARIDAGQPGFSYI